MFAARRAAPARVLHPCTARPVAAAALQAGHAGGAIERGAAHSTAAETGATSRVGRPKRHNTQVA
eukprot:6174229-Pleurochrysis_carterae.AAC.5